MQKKNIANKPKIAAVLALFYPNQKNNVSLLLTKRANYNGTHSGQISFPGGKVEKSDLNLKATALRETFEEVGILRRKKLMSYEKLLRFIFLQVIFQSLLLLECNK